MGHLKGKVLSFWAIVYKETFEMILGLVKIQE